MAHCDYSWSSLLSMEVVSTLLAVLSLLMCVLAMSAMIYYKFYRSFNYRLVLYLLISFFLDALTSCLIVTLAWYYYRQEKPALIEELVCIGMFAVKAYCMWNMQLFAGFMIAEVFSMAIFSVQLRKAEVPLVVACAILPVIVPSMVVYYERGLLSSCLPAIGQENTTTAGLANSTQPVMEYYIVPGVVSTGVCTVAIAVVISYLAYHSLRRPASDGDSGSERESLLMHTHLVQRKYRNALKETLPFTLYPIVTQFVLFFLWLNVILCSTGLHYVFAFADVSLGSVASIIFFVHIRTLGRRRRNVFRNRSRPTTPSNSGHNSSKVRPINDGDVFAPVGSITATHVTDFEPPGESDVELDASGT